MKRAFLALLLGLLLGQPPNDDPCGAISLTPNSGCSYVSGNLNGATATSGPPSPGCSIYSGGDVWYSFVVPPSGRVVIQVNSSSDLGMAIYSATSCSGTFTLIECDDDDGPSLNPTICRTGGSSSGCSGIDPGVSCAHNASLTPGQTIYIRLWRYSNGTPGNTPFQICVIDCGGSGGGICAIQNYTYASVPYTPPPSWCGAGCTSAGITIDDRYAPAWTPIGFNFCFGGQSYTQVLIAANGYIRFQGATPESYDPWTYSGPSSVPTYIAGLWQDIHPGLGGTICYQQFGIAPNRCLRVQYCNVPFYDCTTLTYTGEIVICENGTILVTVQNKPTCSGWNSGAAFLGLNGSGPPDQIGPINETDSPVLTNTTYLFSPPVGCDIAACTPLAIQLVSFTGRALGEAALLEWETGAQTDKGVFEVERSEDLVSWQRIAELPARAGAHTYRYVDPEGQLGPSTFYRLRVQSEDGTEQLYGPIEIVWKSRRPIALDRYDVAGDHPLSLRLIGTQSALVRVWLPNGQLLYETTFTGQGQTHQIPPTAFASGPNVLKITTYEGECFTYLIFR